MGENQKQPFQMSFNRFLRVAFQGSRVTSNGGLILVRELDERLGFGKLVEQHLTDPRANNARLSFADLLRLMYSSGYMRDTAPRMAWLSIARKESCSRRWRDVEIPSQKGFPSAVETAEESLSGLEFP